MITTPTSQDGEYHPADECDRNGTLRGTYLVLSQQGNGVETEDWIVHTDLILGLKLRREGDVWVAIDEGYVPVIRMSRKESGAPSLIEIRATHLKDFLAAKGEFLCVSTYTSREVIALDRSLVDWEKNDFEEQLGPHDRWRGSINEITENGHPVWKQHGFFHVGRKNFDFGQDVPSVSHTDEFDTRSFTRTLEGKKVFRLWGELWKVHYVELSTAQHTAERRRSTFSVSCTLMGPESGRAPSN